ncbi:hypothetical protein RRG08_031017 [Elysia crispata]|uniref:Uncharacterized protein n=1 Tax=Elysia crispata TaxID=231223 RepID=A0AAE1ADT4_9GAST|nr:hypothetical protein RRG08_031017 [Elysia crispata]
MIETLENSTDLNTTATKFNYDLNIPVVQTQAGKRISQGIGSISSNNLSAIDRQKFLGNPHVILRITLAKVMMTYGAHFEIPTMNTRSRYRYIYIVICAKTVGIAHVKVEKGQNRTTKFRVRDKL